MKKFLKICCSVALMAISTACHDGIWEELHNQNQRLEALEAMCAEMNSNVQALKTLVESMGEKDYVTNVSPITENGVEIGYVISFYLNGDIKIYHGKNGADGADGADGQDGHTPVIGVRADENGIYYWTVDGEWLLDDEGAMINVIGSDGSDGADGQDGVTPQLKIEEGYWYVSCDNGLDGTWTKLGPATGASGKDGDSFFQSVVDSKDAVEIVLADGTRFSLAKISALLSWKNGSYEFGKTCDCDYTVPMIDRWVSPPKGERVKAIYEWYDELVNEFPMYVTRESCDDVMASLGVQRPEALGDLPIYMYKFIPPKTPNSSGHNDSNQKRIKAFILTGTHQEYMAIWDCLNTMRLICRNWKEDKNLEELRWNAEIYVIPAYNPYGVNFVVRTNENGVDLNRNAPTYDWKRSGTGKVTYSGPSAGSEYSTKIMQHYLSAIRPQIFIDHHNTDVGSGTDEGSGKNMIYVYSTEQIGIDIACTVISQMTRKWKMRFTDIFPSVEDDPVTLFGYAAKDPIPGSIGRYATEQGVLGTTYESNIGILYKNGEYSTEHRQLKSEVVSTCATEGFLNYLLRSLKVYSEEIGVMQ